MKNFLTEFLYDERDYYGDLKATLIYLSFCGCEVIIVLGIYHWLDKL